MLSISIPGDAALIGGQESSGTADDTLSSGTCSVWIIASTEPLPLPWQYGRTSQRRSKPPIRPKGTPFPTSALANLMAACQVSPDDVKAFAQTKGASHTGEIKELQVCYREAPTDSGWLTAIEIHSIVTMDGLDFSR
ncbi:hypothetical protein [Rubripirellula obstinata]|nr:hypothetical protein [Rubripirellula obstinata]